MEHVRENKCQGREVRLRRERRRKSSKNGDVRTTMKDQNLELDLDLLGQKRKSRHLDRGGAECGKGNRNASAVGPREA